MPLQVMWLAMFSKYTSITLLQFLGIVGNTILFQQKKVVIVNVSKGCRRLLIHCLREACDAPKDYVGGTTMVLCEVEGMKGN
jgi:hypothetical protein